MTATGTGFQLDDVSVAFGSARPALESAALRVEPGEAVAIVGPSGSGKTTLLRLVNGTLRPSCGSIRVGSRELTALAPKAIRALRARIGFVHQDLSLVPNLRTITNVLCGRLGRQSLTGSLRSLLWPSASERLAVHALLERVGIGEKLFERTDRLSGGQRQRVAIARALYQEPLILLADEPVSSIDPARARDTIGLLVEVCKERGLTLCVSLHALDLAREFFPRLVGLRRGRVVFDRPTEQLGDAEFAKLYELSPDELVENAP